MKKICLYVFSALFAVMLSIMVGTSKVEAGNITLSPSSTANYQRAVTVDVDCTGFSTVVTITYVSGNYTVDEVKSLNRIPVSNGQVTIEHNGDYTFVVQAGSTFQVAHNSITNIDKTPDTLELKQRAVNDNKGYIIIDIKYKNKQSEIVEMKYMEGHRSVENFESYGEELTKEETGNYTYLSFQRNGEFSLYVKDACGNESVTYFTVEGSTVVNGDDSVLISGASHIVYELKKTGEQYYIELPMATEDIAYNQGDVVVFTTYNEETGNFDVIDNETYYVYMSKEKVKTLDQDCIRIIISNEFVDENKLKVGDSIVAHYMTRQEAKEIGIKISYFNNNVLIIGGIIIGVLVIAFIYHKFRIKKATDYED